MYKVVVLGFLCLFLGGCTASTQAENLQAINQMATDDEPLSVDEEPLREIHWKLIGVLGKAVLYKQQDKEPYIILKLENNHLQGFGGCNIFMGSYTLEEEAKLSFSKVASTKMACPRMADESAFFKILTQVENYTISDGVLMLYKADKTILATFEPVYPQ